MSGILFGVVSFENVVTAIQEGRVLDDRDHHNTSKHAHQRILTIRIEDYAYTVPYVKKDKDTFFPKTVIPDRKATKKYLRGGDE